MEKKTDECPDISNYERLIDQNWNERKHLTELEFEVRTEIQSLVQRGASMAEFQEARKREGECRDSLARNNTEYDTLIEAWASEVAGPGTEPIKDGQFHVLAK